METGRCTVNVKWALQFWSCSKNVGLYNVGFPKVFSVPGGFRKVREANWNKHLANFVEIRLDGTETYKLTTKKQQLFQYDSFLSGAPMIM